VALKVSRVDGPQSYRSQAGAADRSPIIARRFPLLPTLMLGVGLGGLFDGVVLHQLLQWHHTLSSWYPVDSVANLRINTVWDGIFHSATYALIVTAVFMLWRSAHEGRFPWTRLRFAGALLCGWGLFNVVEGLLNHILLGVHHVNETVPKDAWLWWDAGFLVAGALMVAIGLFLKRPHRASR